MVASFIRVLIAAIPSGMALAMALMAWEIHALFILPIATTPSFLSLDDW
ncbi:MAG: hypothetical protein WD872_15175 [Pirellulaceae bacterium]